MGRKKNSGQKEFKGLAATLNKGNIHREQLPSTKTNSTTACTNVNQFDQSLPMKCVPTEQPISVRPEGEKGEGWSIKGEEVKGSEAEGKEQVCRKTNIPGNTNHTLNQFTHIPFLHRRPNCCTTFCFFRSLPLQSTSDIVSPNKM